MSEKRIRGAGVLVAPPIRGCAGHKGPPPKSFLPDERVRYHGDLEPAMAPLTPAGIRALVSLLDDRAPDVAKRCRAQLFAEGERALEVLEEFVLSGESPPAPGIARRALRELQDRLVDRELSRFAAPPPADLDLEAGVLLIARSQNPALDRGLVEERLDQFATRVRSRLVEGVTTEEQVEIFVDELCRVGGLSGNRGDYFDPDNSFIDQVLIRRTGIPIALSAVYLLVARRVGVPMFGIGLPGHFIVRCGDRDGVFFDPFEDGRRLLPEDCEAHVRRAGFTPDRVLMDPVADRYILARMIANLIVVYEHRADLARVRRLRGMFARLRGETSLA